MLHAVGKTAEKALVMTQVVTGGKHGTVKHLSAETEQMSVSQTLHDKEC